MSGIAARFAVAESARVHEGAMRSISGTEIEETEGGSGGGLGLYV